MEILHICAEDDNHKPHEVIACDPVDQLEDYLPAGFHITTVNTIKLEGIDWPYFLSGSVFVNESYIS
jgi:hypothetical protein